MTSKNSRPKGRKSDILTVAEKMIRSGGYNAFSFRDIAKAIGIKSASIHYHFPTKEDLGAAVAANYSDNFLRSLGDPEDIICKGKDPIACYVHAFKTALVKDESMCLCGLLGAEAKGLPDKVVQEVKTFFMSNLQWLERAYTLQNHPMSAKKTAHATLAALEGAMITSNVLGDLSAFDNVVDALVKLTGLLKKDI